MQTSKSKKGEAMWRRGGNEREREKGEAVWRRGGNEREREKGEAVWRRGGIRFFDRYDKSYYYFLYLSLNFFFLPSVFDNFLFLSPEYIFFALY
jgi:hypothetical protein